MFRGSFFWSFCCKFSEKFFFYLPVNADKPDFVSFLVFVAAAASFTAKILSFETVGKREAILSPVPKQWISKDIPSYWSQSERAKIAIHWFVNNNTDYRQKKGQKPRSPEDEVALASLFGQSWRKWRKISHVLWRRTEPEIFFYEFLKAFKFAATLALPSPSMKIRIVPPVSFSTELRWWIAGRKNLAG